MTILSIIDYSLIVIFFIGMAGFLLLVTRSSHQKETAQDVSHPQTKPVTYVLLTALFLLLIVLTFFVQKDLPQRRDAK